MSELATFVRLGFRHITDLAALDHILFLLALAAIYRGRDWRDMLRVISACTVGHSITLARRHRHAPATRTGSARGRLPALFAGVFGMVHGAGFANYLQTLFIGCDH